MSKDKEGREGMTLIVKQVARLIEPPIFIFGTYLTLTGHLSPGGGFPGGVILACGFILVVLAYGSRRAFKQLNPEGASNYDSTGALLFLFIGALGAILGGGACFNFLRVYLPGRIFHLLSAGNMPLLNVAIAMKVASSLFLVVMALTLFKIRERGES